MRHPFSGASSKHKNLELEYEQTNENIRTLTEIRFKLLALIPPLGGIAVFVLSFIGFSTGGAQPQGSDEAAPLVIVASLFGFMASLGITIYDQRNSELYNALTHRAKFLEELFESPNSPGALRKRKYGGQFQERPKRSRKLFNRIEVGHDQALAYIYGSVLGAWFFPIAVSVGRLLNVRQDVGVLIAALIALFAGIIFIRELIKQDRADQKRWDEAGKSVG